MFFDKYPHLDGKVWVHHAVEQQVLKKYPGLFTEAELHALNNLRGIPKETNSRLRLSTIRVEWNRFYRQFPNATKAQILNKAADIDIRYGHLFNPPR